MKNAQEEGTDLWPPDWMYIKMRDKSCQIRYISRRRGRKKKAKSALKKLKATWLSNWLWLQEISDTKLNKCEYFTMKLEEGNQPNAFFFFLKRNTLYFNFFICIFGFLFLLILDYQKWMETLKHFSFYRREDWRIYMIIPQTYLL